MNSAIERLLGLRVQDVMRHEVVTVRTKDTMGQAAAVLERRDITGAPVVNELGECVGVLSSSDFVHRELTVPAHDAPASLPFEDGGACKPIAPPKAIALNQVEIHMSPLVQTVAQEQSIMNAARLLCDEHIHRLIVVDKAKRPVGIISSLDLVACMVAAVEE